MNPRNFIDIKHKGAPLAAISRRVNLNRSRIIFIPIKSLIRATLIILVVLSFVFGSVRAPINRDFLIQASTMLHSIAVGNILPSHVKTICVDINPATVTKLTDRGTAQALGIVTDVGIFLPMLTKELSKPAAVV